MLRFLLSVCILVASALFIKAGAQAYSLAWSAMPGGGGVSSNAPYMLAGSIGQSGASSVMLGGNYSLTGGFWSLISVVQSPGAPTLSISYLTNQVVVFWLTPLSGWTLQQNSNLASAGGWVASAYALTATNGTSRITVRAPTGKLFFRLAQP